MEKRYARKGWLDIGVEATFYAAVGSLRFSVGISTPQFRCPQMLPRGYSARSSGRALALPGKAPAVIAFPV